MGDFLRCTEAFLWLVDNLLHFAFDLISLEYAFQKRFEILSHERNGSDVEQYCTNNIRSAPHFTLIPPV